MRRRKLKPLYTDSQDTELHERIRFLRVCYPMTQKQLARAIGMGLSVVQHIEGKKRTNILTKTLQKLADALECRLEIRFIQDVPKELDYRALRVDGRIAPRFRLKDPQEYRRLDAKLLEMFPAKSRQRRGYEKRKATSGVKAKKPRTGKRQHAMRGRLPEQLASFRQTQEAPSKTPRQGLPLLAQESGVFQLAVPLEPPQQEPHHDPSNGPKGRKAPVAEPSD